MDSATLLKQLGLNPQAVLDGLTDAERRLLQEQAESLKLTITDLLAMCAAHGLTPVDLKAADLAKLGVGDN
jgi:hypothetical protein